MSHVDLCKWFSCALLRATLFSSCVRCYEPRWSEYCHVELKILYRFYWHAWHVYRQLCTICICNSTESQTFCTSLACLDTCFVGMFRLALACFLGMFSRSRRHVLLTCLKACLDMSFACIICISNSTERQTCCKCELPVLWSILSGYLLSVLQ